MANIAGYETIRSLPSAGTKSLALARRTGARSGARTASFVIHSLSGGDEWETHQSAAAARDFIDAAEVQKRAAEASKHHWVAVHEIDASAGAFVTDYYDKSVEWLVSRHIALTNADLHRLVDSTLAGLAALEECCNRGHGNLKPSNILFTAAKRVARARVALADPAPGRRLKGDARRGDLRALGAMVFELITHEPYQELDHYPLRSGQFNGKIDRNAEKWVQLCNELLNPSGEADLGAVRAKVAKLAPPKKVLPWSLAALLAVGLGVGIIMLATYRKPVTVDEARKNWDTLVSEYENWFDDFSHGFKTEPSSLAALVPQVNDPALTKIDALMKKEIGNRLFPSRMAGSETQLSTRKLRELIEGDHIQGKKAHKVQDALEEIAAVREQLKKLAFRAELEALVKVANGHPLEDATELLKDSLAPERSEDRKHTELTQFLKLALGKRQALRQWRERIEGLDAALKKIPAGARTYPPVNDFLAYAKTKVSEVKILDDPPGPIDEIMKLAGEMGAFAEADWGIIDRETLAKHPVSQKTLDSTGEFAVWFAEAKNSALPREMKEKLVVLKKEIGEVLSKAPGGLVTLEEEKVAAGTIAAYRAKHGQLEEQLAALPASTSKNKFDGVLKSHEALRQAAMQLQGDIAGASVAAREAWQKSMTQVAFGEARLLGAWQEGYQQLLKRPPVLREQRELGQELEKRLRALEKMPALELASAPAELKGELAKLERLRRAECLEDAVKLVSSGAWQKDPSVLAKPVEKYEALRERMGRLMEPAGKLRHGLTSWNAMDHAGKIDELIDTWIFAIREAIAGDPALEAAIARSVLSEDIGWFKALAPQDRGRLLLECEAITDAADTWKLWYAWRVLATKPPAAWSDLKAELGYRQQLEAAAAKLPEAKEIKEQIAKDCEALWKATVQRAANVKQVQASLAQRQGLAPRFDLRTIPWLYYNDEFTRLAATLRPLDKGSDEPEIVRLVNQFAERMKPVSNQLPQMARDRIGALQAALIKPANAALAGEGWPGTRLSAPWKPQIKDSSVTIAWNGHQLDFVRVELNGQGYFVGATEVSIGLFADVYKDVRMKNSPAMPPLTHDRRNGLRGWKASEHSVFLNMDGVAACWEIDVELAAREFGYWGPDMTPEKIRQGPGRFTHLPTLNHPMHFVSYEEAERFAAALDCELPTESLWKEAWARQVKEIGKGQPNLRDAAWQRQRDFADGVFRRNGQQLTSSLTGSLQTDPQEKGGPAEDNAAWLAPVKTDEKTLFHHLVGNVAEYVVGEGANKDKAVVIGGSALTSAKRDPEQAMVITGIGPRRKAFSDAGFRLAFKEPIKPLAKRVAEQLDESGYVLAKL